MAKVILVDDRGQVKVLEYDQILEKTEPALSDSMPESDSKQQLLGLRWFFEDHLFVHEDDTVNLEPEV